MPRRVLIQRDGVTFDLLESPAPNEHHLQEIMKSQPQLIPSDDLGIDGDLLVVGRETSLASGYIDLLCVSRAGDIVLIEFKTGPQNPDFRHALAQLIDYGSDLWRLSIEDFDRGVVQRYLAGGHVVPAFRAARSLDDAIALTDWALTDDDHASFSARLEEVLTTGDFHYVVAAQRFTATMQTSLEYMNATMRFGRFYLVEIVQLTGAELTAHAAQVVAAPPKRSALSAGRTAAGQADEAALLSSITAAEARDAMKDLISACSALGLEIKWREKGASIRFTTIDRRQPLSIGWLLPEGSQWSGARFVTFGVDPASLSMTPSVEQAVLRFATRVSEIPGAQAVTGKLNAFSFDPSVLPEVVASIVAELEMLVTETSGREG